ncbi:MAG: DegT/DnrJ/EryC1/StrS family aminotransferase [Candidatus Eremiobacteraeota bacterium]|nr:DegT/DnrJ/EryC1/StrS family aminotransferase [Candidatus Eremiobacteraeota bacterium]
MAVRAEPDLVTFWRHDLGDAEAAKVAEAIAQRRLSQGPITGELEARLAAYLGVAHVAMTTSGSTALYAAAATLGIGPGDEVILPNRTFIATAHAIMLTGAAVRLVDCEIESTVIDASQIERAITPRTKAILPVHLNGNAADMESINDIARRHGLFVIEDACQALGSRSAAGALGALGTFGCFSLGATKIVTTGQGGFVATSDPALHQRLVLFRNHGVSSTFIARYEHFGFNLKYNDVLASIGLAQLDRIDEYVAKHRAQYRRYQAALADLPFISMLEMPIDDGRVPLWIEAVCSARDRVHEHLLERRIQTRPFLPDLSESPHLGNDDALFVRSKRFRRDGITLPCGPDLSDEQFERTITALAELRDLPPYGA